jgi:tRNA-modifying protein YgfZ
MDSEGLQALESGHSVAWVDLTGWRLVHLAGADAREWLDDLVTAGIGDLGQHRTQRTLLLNRTGQIQADFHVAGLTEGFLLLQDPVQPSSVIDLLDRYVLSSDVSLEGSPSLAVRAVVNAGFVGTVPAWVPSVLGLGHDVILPADVPWQGPNAEIVQATDQDVEVWRIRRGVPRFGVDFGDGTLPSEAGLDHLVDTTKGCFLGQEAVARVRNLGHPRWQVLAFASEQHVSPAAQVYAADEPVGRITSVAPARDAGWALIARVRWEARDADLTAERTAPLAPRAQTTPDERSAEISSAE